MTNYLVLLFKTVYDLHIKLIVLVQFNSFDYVRICTYTCMHIHAYTWVASSAVLGCELGAWMHPKQVL